MKNCFTSSKGQVIVLVALSLIVLLAFVGLALDVGRAYGVRAKLNAAVDAAAIAGGKIAPQGNDSATRAAADNAFHANFPSGTMGLAPSDPTTTITYANGSYNVRVTASIPVPAYFTRVVGWNNFTVSALAETTRTALDMVLVLDTSSSLSSVFNTNPGVKTQSKKFVDFFNPGTDRLGLVAFSTGAYPVVSICGTNPNPTQNPSANSVSCSNGFVKATVDNAIDSLSSNGNTASAEGMKKALVQLNSLTTAAQSKRRVIVFFSDGQPNTSNGRFPTTAGNRDGNLFSETWDPGPPHTLFHPNMYYDPSPANLLTTLVSLPPTDIDGPFDVNFASYNNKRILSGGTSAVELKCDANKAARNMVENVANIARSQGITVYSLGFGPLLDTTDITADCSTSTDLGSVIMKRLANTKDSDSYDPSQPSGLFCRAVDVTQLDGCYQAIANAILRLSK